eukprot:jgi/Botrbrau1/16241/Bobra.0066s0026.1
MIRLKHSSRYAMSSESFVAVNPSVSTSWVYWIFCEDYCTHTDMTGWLFGHGRNLHLTEILDFDISFMRLHTLTILPAAHIMCKRFLIPYRRKILTQKRGVNIKNIPKSRREGDNNGNFWGVKTKIWVNILRRYGIRNLLHMM